MKIFKGQRLASTLICFLMLFVLAGSAMADVIWEPEDDFYVSHSDKCEYLNRDFYANGESGYLEFFLKPGGSSLGFADNGDVFHVQFTYIDDKGDTWGICEYSAADERIVPRADENYKNGWISMEDTVAVYDFLSFASEHSSELVEYGKSYEGLTDAKSIMAWTFPNSGKSYSDIGQVDSDFVIDKTYTDENNRLWGFVGYYHGYRNFWVCLTDPGETNLPELESRQPELYKPQSDTPPQSKGTDMTPALIISVSAAIVISLVLIFTMKKKTKQNKD